MTDDLFSADLTGRGHVPLEHALALVLEHAWPTHRDKPRPIAGWTDLPAKEVENPTYWNQPRPVALGFFFHMPSATAPATAYPLPAPTTDAGALARTAITWLDGLEYEQWGKQPDTDGSVERGWRLRLKELGDDWNEPSILVMPHLQVFGK